MASRPVAKLKFLLAEAQAEIARLKAKYEPEPLPEAEYAGLPDPEVTAFVTTSVVVDPTMALDSDGNVVPFVEAE
jgi:hypothetical protein